MYSIMDDKLGMFLLYKIFLILLYELLKNLLETTIQYVSYRLPNYPIFSSRLALCGQSIAYPLVRERFGTVFSNASASSSLTLLIQLIEFGQQFVDFCKTWIGKESLVANLSQWLKQWTRFNHGASSSLTKFPSPR